MSQPKTLCLNMIVKNEVANLERCLRSVADHISCWVIGDTGSTDGTQELIERFFAARGIPGELHSFPFENFAQARNEALDRARTSGLHFDYLLLTDADMELTLQNAAFSNTLTESAYKVLQNSGVTYWNNRLLRRDVPASYKGVTHEYLEVRAGETRNLEGISFIDHATGSNRVEKYERDVRLLTDAIATERDPGMIARYTFYLANTLRDSGQKEAALKTYLKRSRLGDWQEEVFISLLNAAKLKEALEYSNDEVISAYMEAIAACPTRAEALHGAARFCRNKGIYEQGYEFATQGLAIAYPNDALFVEDWIYEYGLLDELVVNAYWTERYAECMDACDRLLSEGKLPAEMLDRVLKNRNFAVGKVGEAAEASLPEAEHFAKLLRTDRENDPPIEPRNLSRAFYRGQFSDWVPSRPLAGTEIMVETLRRRLGSELDKINLKINGFSLDEADMRPLVVWFHHDVNQAAVQWCRDQALTRYISRFVFVSDWQRERYIRVFGIRPERCVVLRNATEMTSDMRLWTHEPIWRCAYTSTPFRGLSVLLKAWEQLNPSSAELHIWSSMKLYRQDEQDNSYQHLYELASALPGVVYHGIAPNDKLRAALRDIHFLTYPNTFEETSCLAVIEAMASGCRVIAPFIGALPETTAGYARMYPWNADESAHAATFARVLASEMAQPWNGDPELAEAEQRHCAAAYDWARRDYEWRRLIEEVLTNGS
jgi:glycosyltransferase involved in cell wall biosynthesis